MAEYISGPPSPMRDAARRQNGAAQNEVDYFRRKLRETQADRDGKNKIISELNGMVFSLQEDLESAGHQIDKRSEELDQCNDLNKELREDVRAKERDIAKLNAENIAAVKQHEDDDRENKLLAKKNKAQKKELDASHEQIKELKLESRTREDEWAQTTASTAEDKHKLETFVRDLAGPDEKDTPLDSCFQKIKVIHSVQQSYAAKLRQQQEQEQAKSMAHRRRASTVYKRISSQQPSREATDDEGGYSSSSSIPCNTRSALADELEGLSSMDEDDEEDEDSAVLVGNAKYLDDENSLQGFTSHPEPYAGATLLLGQSDLITIAAVEPDKVSSDKSQLPSHDIRTSIGVQTEVLRDQIAEKPDISEQGIQTDESAESTREQSSERVQLEPATRPHTPATTPTCLDFARTLLGNMTGGRRLDPLFDFSLPDSIAQYTRPAPRDSENAGTAHRHHSELTDPAKKAAAYVEHAWHCTPGWMLLVAVLVLLSQLYTWKTDDVWQRQRANKVLLSETCPVSGSDNRWLLGTDRGL